MEDAILQGLDELDEELEEAKVSEEDEDIHWCPGGENAKYILAIDPLDGSSNIDVNASIRKSLQHCLQCNFGGIVFVTKMGKADMVKILTNIICQESRGLMIP